MRSEVKRLPEEFLDRLRRILPPGKFDTIANTFTEPRPTTFRVNTLKVDIAQAEEQLSAAGFRISRVPWYPPGFILREGRLRDLQETALYREGALYVQSLSSMLPVLVLDPKPGETVLDLTAAPGSKTTQIACMMEGRGRLLANDSHRVRAYKLRANVEQQGAKHVEISVCHGETLGRREPDTFDRVLLDAPCSTEGRFQVREPASFRFWKPRKVHEMARKQRKLLTAAVQAAKPGGVIVYATCTFAPEENEAVLEEALSRFGDGVSLEALRLPIVNTMPGLTRWEKASWQPALRRAVRVLPTAEMEAFFIARLRKQAHPQMDGAPVDG